MAQTVIYEEPLINEFFDATEITSKGTYRTYLNKWVLDGLSNPDRIKTNYIDLVAFSIAAGQSRLAEGLLTNILNELDKQKSIKRFKDAYSALTSYYCFVKNIKQEDVIESLKNNYCVFGYQAKDVKNRFKGRLRRQSRISGDKIWLPLSFLAKLYDSKNHNGMKEWIEETYNRIKIVLKFGSDNKHINLNEVLYIGICRSGDVFALYKEDESKTANWYQVMTPSGYLNDKIDMNINGDIGKIVIDHVTPIDKTLKGLNCKYLKQISEYIKQYKTSHSNLKGYKLEIEAFNDFATKRIDIDLNRLLIELTQILNASHYRLMCGGLNLEKSNLFTYTKYFKDKTASKYYVYIGKCKINSTTDGVIYQDLDTNYPNVIYKTIWDKLESSSLEEINAVEVPIDKL